MPDFFFENEPPDTEAVSLGASRIRQLKKQLNVALSKLFSSITDTNASLLSNSITSNELSSAVNDAQDAQRAVTTDHVRNVAITTAKLADNAVTTAKLPDGAVTTAKLADQAVTPAKLADTLDLSAKSVVLPVSAIPVVARRSNIFSLQEAEPTGPWSITNIRWDFNQNTFTYYTHLGGVHKPGPASSAGTPFSPTIVKSPHWYKVELAIESLYGDPSSGGVWLLVPGSRVFEHFDNNSDIFWVGASNSFVSCYLDAGPNNSWNAYTYAANANQTTTSDVSSRPFKIRCTAFWFTSLEDIYNP